jgi:MFS family permease
VRVLPRPADEQRADEQRAGGATVRRDRSARTGHRSPHTVAARGSQLLLFSVPFGIMSPPVAPPGWSRWLVPPAALSVHLSIGQAYAWSVFKPPLEAALHLSGTESALPFQLAIVMLGLSAAFGGTLVERNGPRWAMTVALVCFSTGFLISALGAQTQQ